MRCNSQGVVNMEIQYKQMGDYQIPDLILEQPEQTLGKYGEMRKQFLMEHKSWKYQYLLMRCQLAQHLLEIDQTAQRREQELIQAMCQKKQVNEALKEKDPMQWVSEMNQIRHAAEEIILEELIHS